MRSAERDQDAVIHAVASTEEGPALRDAAAAAGRAEADEAEARDARARLRDAPPSEIPADDRIAPHLEDDELVYDIRPSTILRPPSDDRALGYGGTLYLTSKRLVHMGQVTINVQLADIAETAIAGERLLITLSNGEGISLDLDRPRLLRTEIAAATRGTRT